MFIVLQSSDNNDDTTNRLRNRVGQRIDEFFIILYNNIIQDQLSKTIICIGLGFSEIGIAHMYKTFLQFIRCDSVYTYKCRSVYGFAMKRIDIA